MSVEGALLTSGSVGRHLYHQTLPMVIGILALMSVGLLDAYFIGNLGKDPLTAVSFIFPVVFALSSLGVGVIAAIASVVSRALGSGQKHKAQSLVALGIVAAGIFGIVITVLLLLFKRPLFEVMNASPDLLPLIDSYMTPFAFGFPMLLINMGGNGALRAQGMAGKASLISRRPSMVSTAPPIYPASPLAAGNTSGSKMMSSSGTRYFSVSSRWPRRARRRLWRRCTGRSPRMLAAAALLGGKKAINDLDPGGADVSALSRRVCRAHANCYENLPLSAAVMLYAIAAGSPDGMLMITPFGVSPTDTLFVTTRDSTGALADRSFYLIVH